MKDKFKESLRLVLVHEGGKVDDPRDPGGRTNKGVTQKTFNAWLRSKGKKARDVFTMTDEECAAIYKQRFWDVINGDNLPPGVDYVVFDGAVNSGPAQSVKWLQRALGVTADGQLGVMTMDKLGRIYDHDELIASIGEQRMKFLQALKHWKTYKNGWTKRVKSVTATGQAWARGSIGPEVEYTPGSEARAMVSDAKPLPTRGPADVVTGVGATLTAGAQAVNEAKDAIAPAADFGFANNVLVALTIAGVILAICGIVYRFYISKKKQEMSDALGNQAS
jgi:lysozyme family protein